MADEVLSTVADGVATITLNRPDKRNAMNAALLSALRDRFDALDGRADARVVVLRGAGSAFCAGMDLREMEARQGAPADGDAAVIPVLQRVERSRHPTIAMVHGDAFAGGLELALHCDLRVAADIARFGMPLARLGLVVPFPFGQKIVEIVGPAHARQLLLTGRPVDARRAYAIGMLHEVVPAADLARVTGDLARSIAENAPRSLAGMKAVILRALASREGIAHHDLDALARSARQSADASEGRLAMLEKRRPVFRGE